MRIGNRVKWWVSQASRVATVVCLLLTGLAPYPVLAQEEPSAGAMTADLVVARPLGIVATALGSAAFIVSLPFSALGGNVKESADALVVGPAKSAFVRCLGCISVNPSEKQR